MSTLNFSSAKNYMKRAPTSGSTSLAAPTTDAYGGFPFPYVTRKTIAHGLGVVPFINVFYEPFADGVIWEAMSTRNARSAINPRNTAADGPYCIAWADATNVTIEIGYSSNTLSGTFPVYYVIYRDYGLA